MRGFEQVRKSLNVAGLMLLLLLVSAMGSICRPSWFPRLFRGRRRPRFHRRRPFFRRSQTVPVAFDVTGMLQYASLDPTPGLCTWLTPARHRRTPRCRPSARRPVAGLKSADTVIKVPANLVVVFPNTLMTWEEAFENNPFINPPAS